MITLSTFIFLLLCILFLPVNANLGGGDGHTDDPTIWQYIVIALGLAFIFMAVLVCVQVARLRRRSELLDYGMRPIIHITRSGARVYAPPPILTEEEVERLDIVDYSDGDMEEQSCSICLDVFRSTTKVRLLPCRHAFHPVCIDPWLTKHSAECPMCKQSCVEFVRQKGLKDHLQTLRNTLDPAASNSRSAANNNSSTEAL